MRDERENNELYFVKNKNDPIIMELFKIEK